MKKLLYITANTKPEAQSASKTVGRALVKRLQAAGDVTVEELDLYTTPLPKLQYSFFEGRNTLLGADGVGRLSPEQQADIAQINRLCDQFVSADWYVLAAPMWSLSFPAVVKEYLDCIVIAGKTITFEKEKPRGLLGDRPRSFVYVQSSGGALPWVLRPVLNKGADYFEEIAKFIGISDFYQLLADGTGTTPQEQRQAVADAVAKADALAEEIRGK